MRLLLINITRFWCFVLVHIIPEAREGAPTRFSLEAIEHTVYCFSVIHHKRDEYIIYRIASYGGWGCEPQGVSLLKLCTQVVIVEFCIVAVVGPYLRYLRAISKANRRHLMRLL